MDGKVDAEDYEVRTGVGKRRKSARGVRPIAVALAALLGATTLSGCGAHFDGPALDASTACAVAALALPASVDAHTTFSPSLVRVMRYATSMAAGAARKDSKWRGVAHALTAVTAAIRAGSINRYRTALPGFHGACASSIRSLPEPHA